MSTFVTGRTLDATGTQVDGTGFTVERGGPLADLLADRTGPITSHPTRPVWGVPLDGPDGTVRQLSIFGSGYDGPPEHYHTQSEEAFDVRQGTVTFTLDGTDRVVAAGERATVDPGVRHTFRNEGDRTALVITTIHDPGRLQQVLPTLGGLAHDDDRDPGDPLQRAVIAERLRRNTVFTDGEGPLAELATGTLAPVARLAGYRAAYAEYMRPSFWRRHVEQPEET
jgi:mannose-6-phosphate isomerase-like protein (cupin superfamily)